MRRRGNSQTIVIALTASVALAACEQRTCVDEVTHEVLPDDQCSDKSSAAGSYHPHVWWHGGRRVTTPEGTQVVSGGSAHSSSGHSSSGSHGSGYHGSGGHGFGSFHGGFGA